jgi:hypothetical protein
VDTAQARLVIVSPILMLMLWRHSFDLCRPEPISVSAYLDTVIDLMMHGLLPPSSLPPKTE